MVGGAAAQPAGGEEGGGGGELGGVARGEHDEVGDHDAAGHLVTFHHHLHLGPPREPASRRPQPLALVQAGLQVLHLVELGLGDLAALPHHRPHLPPQLLLLLGGLAHALREKTLKPRCSLLFSLPGLLALILGFLLLVLVQVRVWVRISVVLVQVQVQVMVQILVRV